MLLLVTNMKYMTIIPYNIVLVTLPYLLYFLVYFYSKYKPLYFKYALHIDINH